MNKSTVLKNYTESILNFKWYILEQNITQYEDYVYYFTPNYCVESWQKSKCLTISRDFGKR